MAKQSAGKPPKQVEAFKQDEAHRKNMPTAEFEPVIGEGVEGADSGVSDDCLPGTSSSDNLPRAMTSLKRCAVVSLTLAAGVDTAFGVIIFAFGGLTGGGYDRGLFISFMLGFPACLADTFSNKSICIYLTAIFLFRWAFECLAGSHPGFVNPIYWPMGILLFLALALLQAAKRLAVAE